MIWVSSRSQPVADAEHEPAAAAQIEPSQSPWPQQRVALGDPAPIPVGAHVLVTAEARGERHERIDEVRVALGDDAVGRAAKRLGRVHGDERCSAHRTIEAEPSAVFAMNAGSTGNAGSDEMPTFIVILSIVVAQRSVCRSRGGSGRRRGCRSRQLPHPGEAVIIPSVADVVHGTAEPC